MATNQAFGCQLGWSKVDLGFGCSLRRNCCVTAAIQSSEMLWFHKSELHHKKDISGSRKDLTMIGQAYQKTLMLLECSMFAPLGGLAYILSSSLAIEISRYGEITGPHHFKPIGFCEVELPTGFFLVTFAWLIPFCNRMRWR
ncbi:unnamed protein product [Lactuca saligna]|uniref:Uncharacterized protein n=1 Tax=Lactuca saligna TaxID=75948 RepID=A0AA35ZS06_LACSI|nr:unnamed protein product [Lactuca saligna]